MICSKLWPKGWCLTVQVEPNRVSSNAATGVTR
jgi:hypothetical protein